MMATGLECTRTPHPHQQRCNDALIAKLVDSTTALVVVPTGGGKTWSMGFYLADQMPVTAFPKVLVLQHTGTLLRQNRATIAEATRAVGAATSVVKAAEDDWSGDIVFGSICTVAKPRRLAAMPVITHLIVDEGHRAGGAGYKRVIAHARRLNPWVKIILFTATPNRADGGTIATPADLAFQITYAELIDCGILVPVDTRTIDLGLRKDFERIGMSSGEYDMATLGALLDKQVHHQSVVDHWIDQGGRERGRTAAFCPTVAHGRALCAAFVANGVNAVHVHGEMDEDEVDRIIEEYDAGRHQVIVNCMMLIEGWDSPVTDCIINLRMMAAELTFLQAVGRGMRASPGKRDCLLLDFAGAALRHGTIETRVVAEREAQVRAETAPHAANDNPVVERKALEVITDFTMREIDIMRRSKPRFVEVPGDVPAMVAVARGSWAGVLCIDGMWHCATRVDKQELHVMSCTTGNEAMALADAFLLSAGPASRRDFESQPPTFRQIRELKGCLIDDPQARKSRYDAECFLAAFHARTRMRAALRQRGYPKAA